MEDEPTFDLVWILERRDRGSRAEIHAHPVGWEVRVYVRGQLAVRRAFGDIRDAHDTAVEALK